jgi:hypothetical protein
MEVRRLRPAALPLGASADRRGFFRAAKQWGKTKAIYLSRFPTLKAGRPIGRGSSKVFGNFARGTDEKRNGRLSV